LCPFQGLVPFPVASALVPVILLILVILKILSILFGFLVQLTSEPDDFTGVTLL
jgi:hypothetical protein